MADIKNFGLTGVADNVQYGKGGPRIKNNAGVFQVKDSTDASLVNLQVAAGVAADDAVNLSQLQAVSSGIKVLPSCRVSTTAELDDGDTLWIGQNPTDPEAVATWGAPGAATGPGSFTGMSDTLDGVTLVALDRILVRHEGITESGGSYTIDNTQAYKNGIYVVATLGTGANGIWNRADDHGGLGNGSTTGTAQGDWDRDNENIGFGDTIFVSEGTLYAGESYTMSNLLNVDTTVGHREPHLNIQDTTQITDDAAAVTFVLLSASQTYTADNGVQLDGSNFRMDIDTLSADTIATTSLVAFGDTIAGGPDKKSTVSDMLSNLNLVTSTANGVVVQTAANTFASRTITASAVAGDEGISIVDGDGVSGNPTVGLDIIGLTSAAGATAGTDVLVLNDGTKNSKVTAAEFIADLNVATSAGTGFVYDNAGTFVAGTITEAGAGNLEGASVVNTAGAVVVGVDIINTTDLTGTLAAGDEFLVYDLSLSANVRATMADIDAYVSSGLTTNQISQLDTSVTATDTGTDGAVTINVDGATVGVWGDSGLTADSLTASDLTSGRVVLAGTAGLLTDNAGLTSDGTTLIATGAVSGATMTSASHITSTSGNITASAGNVVAGGDITATGGTISGLNVTATGVGTFASLVDQSLLITNGVVYASAGNLAQDAGFTYDATGDTLTVTNIVATNYNLDVTDTLILFGDTTAGEETSDTEFSYNATTDVLTVGTGVYTGTAGSGPVIGTNVTNGDITLTPDGTGEVIISGTGGAEISADSGESMTLRGDDFAITNVAGTQTFATFGTDTGTTVNYLDFKSTITTVAPTITATGTDTNVDIELLAKGTGTVIVTDASYETNMVDNSLSTKAYVDNAISTAVVPGAIASVTGTVDLSSTGTTNIGAVLPANVTILRVYANVTTADTATGDLAVGVSGSVDSYMDELENDTQTIGKYISDGVLVDASTSDQIIATVAGTPGGSGSATVTVEYRYV